jgi:hypothetical protein
MCTLPAAADNVGGGPDSEAARLDRASRYSQHRRRLLDRAAAVVRLKDHRAVLRRLLDAIRVGLYVSINCAVAPDGLRASGDLLYLAVAALPVRCRRVQNDGGCGRVTAVDGGVGAKRS